MKKILAIGPLPPPTHGVSLLHQSLLSSVFTKRYEVYSLDIADRRGLINIGVLDWTNISLAMKHCLKLVHLLIQYRPQIVLLYISQGFWGFVRDGAFIWLVRFLSTAKIVSGLHGSSFRSFYSQSNHITKLFISKTLNQITAMTVLGKTLTPIFSGLLPDNRIHVVPNGISESTFADAKSRARHFTPMNRAKNEPPIILYLSSLDERKGFVELLETVPHVVEKFPDAQFLFAGNWSKNVQKNRINNEVLANTTVAQLGIENHVNWLGPVGGDYKIELFYKASIFVLPTRYPPEGQPVSIIEAMASGLPVITCNRGAITDLIIDGEGGYIVPENNIQILAEKIIFLLSNPIVARRMGLYNRRRYECHFTLSNWVDNICEVIESVV